MDKIYKCFVSSTYDDLKEERKKVFEVILDQLNMPVGMEHFNASDDSQWTYITKMLEGCDYFILIVAHRYGSTTDEGISYTEKETRYAKEHSIPVLAFLIAENAEWPGDKYEKSRKNERRLNSFKEWLKKDAIIRFWKNKDDLGLMVSNAMHTAIRDKPRPGYVRGEAFGTAQQNSDHDIRKPDFRIEFSGKDEIKINLNQLAHPDQMESLPEISPLTSCVPQGLEKMVTAKSIEDWNFSVARKNEEIEEYNKHAIKYNEQLSNVPLPFTFANEGTMKGHEIRVKLIFPEWMKIADAKFLVPAPTRPENITNPVRMAMNRMKGQKLPDSEDIQCRLDMLADWDKNIVVPKDFDPAGVRIEISGPRTATFKCDQLQHLTSINCSGLYVCPPQHPCKGLLEISCHCDELPRPQKIEIPIIVYRE